MKVGLGEGEIDGEIELEAEEDGEDEVEEDGDRETDDDGLGDAEGEREIEAEGLEVLNVRVSLRMTFGLFAAVVVSSEGRSVALSLP